MTNILVISNDELLLSGVARMLGDSFSVIIQQVMPYNEEEMISTIQTTGIDDVIVDLSLITSGQIQVMTLLNCKNKLRLFLMSLHSNEFQIFEKQEVILTQSEDLASLLERPKMAMNVQSLSLFTEQK